MCCHTSPLFYSLASTSNEAIQADFGYNIAVPLNISCHFEHSGKSLNGLCLKLAQNSSALRLVGMTLFAAQFVFLDNSYIISNIFRLVRVK